MLVVRAVLARVPEHSTFRDKSLRARTGITDRPETGHAHPRGDPAAGGGAI